MKYVYLILVSMVGTINLNVAQQEWRYNENPAASGWDTTELSEFRNYIIDSTVVTSLMIIHDGQVVLEYGDIKEMGYIASCRKSLLSMLYGRYVEDGTIDLNKTMEALGIDDVEGLSPAEKQATIMDIISARSGVYHPVGYLGSLEEFTPNRGSKDPGEYWFYNNWDFNVAGYVFEKETGNNIYDEIENQLVVPLGMQDWDRSIQGKIGDTTKSRYLAYVISLSTRDMAKIGQLMLQKGSWNGEQLISQKWVSEMVKQRTGYKEVNRNIPIFKETGMNIGYGYMWWLIEEDKDPRLRGAYAALGHWGQAIAVCPEINVVVAYKTNPIYERANRIEARLRIFRKTAHLYDPE